MRTMIEPARLAEVTDAGATMANASTQIPDATRMIRRVGPPNWIDELDLHGHQER